MPQFRSHSPGEEDPRPEQRTTAQKRESPMAEHPAPGFTPPPDFSQKSEQTTQKSPDGCTRVPSIRRFSDDDADHPHHPTDRPPDLPGEKPPEKGILPDETAPDEPPPKRRAPPPLRVPSKEKNPTLASPGPVPARITSSCRRWSSWQPSERRSWRQRPSERRSSGPSSRPRQRWHPRRRRSSSQRSCANGASWASPP